jgi:pantoate--beta-alanine ligase
VEIITTIQAMRAARPAVAQLALVPTMGFLHAGHMRLIDQARTDCDHVVVSIFVNPTQFAPHEDFASYPRDMDHDMELLRAAGVALVFMPSADEMYPPTFSTYVDVERVTDTLEGAARPGFFRGVATVVCKLLHIVQPTHTYFGQKDAQQAVVVRKLVRDLNIPTTIIVGPTVREPDGLALSSRNSYLSPAERQAAPVLYRALTAAQHAYQSSEHDCTRLRAIMRDVLASEPLAQVEYVSAADPETLRELAHVGERGALLSLAVRIGPARLIDNIVLEPPAPKTAPPGSPDPDSFGA